MNKRLLMVLVVLAALATAPAANAGCFATVKLSSMPTGRTWTVDVTPLQHGRTLLAAAKPRIEIRNGTGVGARSRRGRRHAEASSARGSSSPPQAPGASASGTASSRTAPAGTPTPRSS